MRGPGWAGPLGLVSLAAAGVAIARPELVAEQDVGELVTLGVGFVAVGLGLLAVSDRLRATDPVEPLAPPEAPRERPVPGDEIDDLLRRLRPFSRQDVGGSDATLRDRLERVAVRTLQRKRGCSRERARQLVREGRWTDDPVASAFLQPGVATPSPRDSRIDGFVAFVRSESARPAQVRRVIEAIDALDTEGP